MGRKAARPDLGVFLDGRRVGTLSRSRGGALAFRYAPAWLSADDALPVSNSMPLREEAYRDDRVHAYFDNLLPDSMGVRRLVAERLGARSAGAFDLLALVGRDCVGALQILPEGVEATAPSRPRGTPLTEADVAAVLRDLPRSPLGMHPDADFRISIAGAQEKTALLHWKGRWHRPEGTTPTTHILKPALGLLPGGIDMRQSVENELLCLALARHFGLSVPEAGVLDFGGVRCLSVERFDRRWTETGRILRRLPQEDLCQAFGIPSTRKYESEGGPGIPQVMRFLDASDDRDGDREAFLRAQMVFFLLGAVDGHAKNFSVFLTPTGFRLTPLYDVLSIEPEVRARRMAPGAAKLSMCVGDGWHYRLQEIRLRHWEETAKASGFPATSLAALAEDIIERARRLEEARARLPEPIPDALAETVIQGTLRRARTMEGARRPGGR